MKCKLEIILITYNRKNHLLETFRQIFAETSPIKNLPITILDNKSTDGTSELIKEYQTRFPNIKHIIHNHNIGGDANISRAFEIAHAQYVWILCDDDEYDFSHWNEVEAEIEKGTDAIVVANYINPNKNTAQLIKQMTFVPSTIYKTENITDTVCANMNFCISTKFSQLAIVCYLINNNKKIKILDNHIVNMIPHGGYESYTRGLDKNRHPYLANNFWEIGFINSVQMIEDKALRFQIIDNMGLATENLFETFRCIININHKNFNNTLKNILDILAGINMRQKITFIFAYLSWYCPLWINYNQKERKLHLRILNLKTHIRF